MAVIIDGKKVSQEIRDALKARALVLREKAGIVPGLAVVLVGEEEASKIYVRRKDKACAEVGFLSRQVLLPADTEERQILDILKALNRDREIHGILVQLPLPRQIHTETMIEAIDPPKDVDGFHPYNMGRLLAGLPLHKACTPSGIIALLDYYGIAIEGKEAVIVGRSNIVGKPLALMLLARHATVTICHTKTKGLPEVTRRAEILVVAAGKPGMISADMVREGAVVIDVGMNRLPDGSLIGDVAYAAVAQKASYITPVPGGVGPMTIALLLQNTLNAALGTFQYQ